MLKIFRKKSNDKSDLELLAAYQASGDLEVLGELFERYMELVFGVCLKTLKDREKAEDAVMSVFEELVVKAKEHEIRQFRGWLHVLTRNYCLMQLRKQNKYSTVSFDAKFMQSTETVHPMEEVGNNGTEKALKTCLDKLSEKQKRCVGLFYFQNKSYKEIAELTGEELGKVRSFIQNGRRNLKICIEKTTKPLDNNKTIETKDTV